MDRNQFAQRNSISRFIATCIVSLLVHSCSSSSIEGPVEEPLIPIPQFNIAVDRSKVTDASVVLLRIDLEKSIKDEGSMKLKAMFEKTEIPLYTLDEEHPEKLISIIAIPYLYEKKTAVVSVELTGNHKQKEIREIKLSIKQNTYRKEKLKVDPEKVIPPEKAMTRIEQERKVVTAIYNRKTPKKFWLSKFELPIDSVVTSPFGNKRLYNREIKSFHSGVDFRASVGTPIQSTERGVVVLARDLYFTGNTIIVDHGLGVFSLYAHLSRISVKEDKYIDKGEVVGEAGSTGRVNGPHLHWSIIVSGAKINPMEILNLNL